MGRQVDVVFLESRREEIKWLRILLRNAARWCFRLKCKDRTPQEDKELEAWENREAELLERLEEAELSDV